MAMKCPNEYRVRSGMFASTDADGNNGLFLIPMSGQIMKAVISEDPLWEHVSVSLRRRCPTWEEMCRVKALFWDDEDCVMQLHPPKSEWVNNHPYCLHMWKPKLEAIPRPPSWMVGLQELGELPCR